jgi:hypothetical protein
MRHNAKRLIRRAGTPEAEDGWQMHGLPLRIGLQLLLRRTNSIKVD